MELGNCSRLVTPARVPNTPQVQAGGDFNPDFQGPARLLQGVEQRALQYKQLQGLSLRAVLRLILINNEEVIHMSRILKAVHHGKRDSGLIYSRKLYWHS